MLKPTVAHVRQSFAPAIVAGFSVLLTSGLDAADPQPDDRPGIRMPALLKKIVGTRQPATRHPVSSRAVLEQLRALYRQNGLAMPAMTLGELDKRRSASESIAPVEHTTPQAPPVEFLPDTAVSETGSSPSDKDLLPSRPTEPLPTPSPTNVQKTVEAVRQKQTIAARGFRYGLKGFCPVALKDERRLADALPEHNITYQGRVFLLSSAEAREAFAKNPESYLPVAGGMDVITLNSPRPNLGRLDFATWYKDRLYLFSTKENLRAFQAKPARFRR